MKIYLKSNYLLKLDFLSEYSKLVNFLNNINHRLLINKHFLCIISKYLNLEKLLPP